METEKRRFNFYLIPIMIILAVIPLIRYVYVFDPGLSSLPYMSDKTVEADFELYYKMIALTVMLGVMAVCVMVKLVVEGTKLNFCKIFIPLAGYLFFAVISTVSSEHSHYSLVGFDGLFQSIWALMAYGVAAYYTFLVVNDARDVMYLLIALMAGVGIMVLIGLSQAFHCDIFFTEFGKWLTIPSEYYDQRDKLKRAFEEGRVYLTLYNPNYVGSYVSLLAPVFAMMALSFKRISAKIVSAVITVGLLFCLFASQSRAGFVGVIMAIVLLIVIFNREVLKHRLTVIVSAAVFVAAFIGINIYNGGILTDRLADFFYSESGAQGGIDSIETLDKEVRIRYNGNNLHVIFEEMAEGYLLYPYDDNESPIECEIGDDFEYILTDPRFEGITLKPVTLDETTGYIGFLAMIDGRPWNFYNDGKSYYYMQYTGKYMKLKPSKSVEFLDEHAMLATGRGYIWSHTLPLLGDYIIKGAGPDNFFFAFPNDDQVALVKYGMENLYNVKPHNMYLQIWVETGLLSLLCVLAYYCMYFIPGLIMYFKLRRYDFLSLTGIGILCGTFGYMVVGLINDSMVVVAPVFWALSGLGVAVNLMVRRQQTAKRR